MDVATSLDDNKSDIRSSQDYNLNLTTAIRPKLNSDPEQIKHAIKILRFLRDDITRTSSKVNRPSTWVLRSLVHSCDNIHYQPDTWLQDIRSILQTLTAKSQQELNGFKQFRSDKSDTPLFPNNENFTASDLVLFIYRLKLHLARIENELD